VLTLVTIVLIVAAFTAFASSLGLLSGEELRSFHREHLFSAWYFAALCALCVGLLVVDDLAPTVALASAALAFTVYEHVKHAAKIGRMQVSERFKRRMQLTAWLADAVVLAIIVDAVLSHLHDVDAL
jgi:hypothetical protein